MNKPLENQKHIELLRAVETACDIWREHNIRFSILFSDTDENAATVAEYKDAANLTVESLKSEICLSQFTLEKGTTFDIETYAFGHLLLSGKDFTERDDFLITVDNEKDWPVVWACVAMLIKQILTVYLQADETVH